MRDSSHRAALAQLVAIAVAVGLVSVVLAGVAGEDRVDGGGKVVWVSPEDRQGMLEETLNGWNAWALSSTRDHANPMPTGI